MTANAESSSAASFLQRLTSYSLVKYSFETTRHLYNEAKEKNHFVKKGLEFAETSVGTVAASPLVQNVGRSWEPLLSKADEFGCHQLDKAEAKLFVPAAQLYETANVTITKIVGEKVANSKKLVEEKVVQPISSTYQQLVALPTVLTNKVFDFAEDSVEYYLPQEAENEEDETAPQETDNEKTQTVWARSGKLSRRAYRRAQRKAAHRVRIAKLYGESVLTKYPLAVTAVNYVRTRDPEVRKNLVEQVKTTVTYYTDKTKGFLAESPLVQKATSFVQPYLANVSYQSFYSMLFTLLAAVSITQAKPATKRAPTSSTSYASNDSAAPTHNETDETHTADEPLEDDEDNETSGPAEPDNSDVSEEEKDDKVFDAPVHDTKHYLHDEDAAFAEAN